MKYLILSKPSSNFTLFGLLLCCFLFVNCKSYHKATSLTQASTEKQGLVKVTLLNGDEYIYSSLETEGNSIYGIQKNKEGTERVLLNNDEVKEVRRYNKSGSTFFKVLGFGVLIGSGILAASML